MFAQCRLIAILVPKLVAMATSFSTAVPLSNMIPAAHPSPQPKQHLDRFSRIRTGDRRVSLYFTMGRPFPPSKLPLPIGDLDLHLIHGSLVPPESSTQMASRSVQPFSHRGPQSVPILYSGTPLSPSQLLLPMGGSGPHLMHGSFGSPESSTQTASRSVQPFLQGLLV